MIRLRYFLFQLMSNTAFVDKFSALSALVLAMIT